VGVSELTDHVRLNHNAVRQHLAVLKDAGLVTEEVEDRDRAGRPRLLYRLHPEVAGSWGTPGPYAWLASLLSDAIRRKQDPRQVGRQDGYRRGFRPTRVERGRRVDFVLGRCPFAEVAISDPDTVCQLHRGMAEGLTEGLDGLAVEKPLPKDPRRAGCRLTVRRATTGTGAPA
jgi:predicted ArsR family transcriptional regulator